MENRLFKTIFLICGIMLARAANASEFQKTLSTCVACHAQNGNTSIATFPKLAGQLITYIEKELKAYRSKTRETNDTESQMWTVTANLDDATISQLAKYFADQEPMRGLAPENPALIKKGERLYTFGVPALVMACASCHGAKGEGVGHGPFPRIAGQNKDYLVNQLKAFRSGIRHDATVMSSLVVNLSDYQADAIATYLQSVR